jgi:hypothetical protein
MSFRVQILPPLCVRQRRRPILDPKAGQSDGQKSGTSGWALRPGLKRIALHASGH